MSESTLATPRRLRLRRRRAICLIVVHLAIGLHIAHWLLAGRTLAPLELNEVMYTLELGVVTAGFLLMATAVASVAIVGRFFCSWGCHLLALQDLSAALLDRLGARPSPLRSRWLAWVPAGAAFYMFLWPQIARVIGRAWPAAVAVVGPRPEFRPRILAEGEGWASFLTSDFARNLPGPGIALATFVVCGWLVVRMLGTRAFCRDICPYGAVFSLTDRLAPGRIVLAGECTACARCTAVCDSGVRVHEEIARWGRVTSGDCLKDLDCVGVCPTGALAFGFTRPPFFGRRAVTRPWDLSWGEEAVAVTCFLVALFSWRGLYRTVPFLLSLALGLIAAVVGVTAARVLRRPEVRLQTWCLRRSGRLTRGGVGFLAAAACVGLATCHAAVVRTHEVLGDRLWEGWSEERARGLPGDEALADRLLGHFDARARWGVVRTADLDPRRVAVRVARAEARAARGELGAAERELAAALALAPGDPVVCYDRGVVLAGLGRTEEAIAAYREAIRAASGDAESHNNLGLLLWKRGDDVEAEQLFRRARALAPGYPLPCLNLGALLAEDGRGAEAAAIAASCPPPGSAVRGGSDRSASSSWQ